MIELSVNCSKMRARLTEEGCRKNQAIRECCQNCEHRDKKIKYGEVVREKQIKCGKNATITKHSGSERHSACGASGRSVGADEPSRQRESVADTSRRAVRPAAKNNLKPFWRPAGFTRHNEIRRGWPKGKSRRIV